MSSLTIPVLLFVAGCCIGWGAYRWHLDYQVDELKRVTETLKEIIK